MTRISDYKHHWSDVLAGALIGATFAIVVVSFFFVFFTNAQWSRSKIKLKLIKLRMNSYPRPQFENWFNGSKIKSFSAIISAI